MRMIKQLQIKGKFSNKRVSCKKNKIPWKGGMDVMCRLKECEYYTDIYAYNIRSRY